MQSDARVAHNYQWAPVAAHAGPTNAAGQGRLYKSRLEAQLALNARSAEEGHGGKAWNEKRRRAIERGEDPNSELLDAIARRRPDSYLERGWRWITGKKATKHEEALAQEEKERRKREAEEQQTLQGVEVSGFEPEEVKGGRKMKEKDDGVIR